jgi:hypothetical protein
MATPPLTIALPWYRRSHYRPLLAFFSDPDKMPATYDAWLTRAELTESQLQTAGFAVARIWIEPIPFAAWCREHNVSPDQRSRLTFANEAAKDFPAQG